MKELVLEASRAPFDLEACSAAVSRLARSLDRNSSLEDAVQAVLAWDEAMAEQQTWSAAIAIRFRQYTNDEEARRAKEAVDGEAARLEGHRRTFLAALFSEAVTPEIRASLSQRFGTTCMARWQAELRSFHPSVGELLAREQKLKSQHTSVIGSARVLFQGQEQTLSAVSAHLTSADRAVRREAAVARWGWFESARDELDEIFGDLVRVRTEIARGLKPHERDASFTEVAYDRMRRTDYSAADVGRMRDEIAEHIVPLAGRLRERQARELGLAELKIHDELIYGEGRSPRPKVPAGGDGVVWLEARAAEIFDEIDSDYGTKLASLFERMRQGGMLDLGGRPAKGPGGFCSFLPKLGLPFIFANFNGTAGDARVFTHEMGHAYQGASAARHVELTDQRRCTSETAEIHSMSLEFLTWPYMDRFFGEDAARFRQEHVASQLAFLPYGCAIDHFQHEVYANPGWKAADRHACWRDLERRYLPWRRWDGIAHGESGCAWQAQLHVFQYPFYYIDYVLAELVAFQFLGLSERDAGDAWSRFQALCDLGGSRGFRELVTNAAQMLDPFAPGAVPSIAADLEDRVLRG